MTLSSNSTAHDITAAIDFALEKYTKLNNKSPLLLLLTSRAYRLLEDAEVFEHRTENNFPDYYKDIRVDEVVHSSFTPEVYDPIIAFYFAEGGDRFLSPLLKQELIEEKPTEQKPTKKNKKIHKEYL